MRRPVLLWGGVIGVATAAGILGAIVVRTIDAEGDPRMRVFTDLPVFEPPTWMDPADADGIAAVEAIGRKAQWNDRDATVILTAMRRDDPGELDPDSPANDLRLPPPGAGGDEVDAWMRQPGASELASWLARTRHRSMAWGIMKERFRLGLELPQAVSTHALDVWVRDLHSSDPAARLQAASDLIYTRRVDDDSIRVQLEALRLGDPSADVRAALDRGLKHYDQIYHGIEPDGPTSECNTCP